jgi:pimeloyl-ACP methyl ester carboxylesterase
LRRALGEQATGPRFIETIPRVGYRFVADVSAPSGERTALAPAPPVPPERTLRQEIRFATTSDGVRIAYSAVGSGVPLVKAANWLNHLEYEWESPVWRHWIHEISRHHLLVRYDERGCGLSDWQVPELTFESWVRDLETVVDTLGLERFDLLGISQGGPVAVTYAVRHPERVRNLILYGTYARGWQYRGDPQVLEARARFMEDFSRLDVRDVLADIKVPSIVLHCQGDAVVPFDEGRLLAAGIPGARFVPLPSRNHLLLEQEPAWQMVLRELGEFLGWKDRR